MIHHILWSTFSREGDWVVDTETWILSMWSTLQCHRYLCARGWLRCWENCLDWRELPEEPDTGCIINFTFLLNCFFYAHCRWSNGLAVVCSFLVLYNSVTLCYSSVFAILLGCREVSGLTCVGLDIRSCTCLFCCASLLCGLRLSLIVRSIMFKCYRSIFSVQNVHIMTF